MSSLLSAEEPSSAEKWWFTWEAQSHTSILRLLLFNPSIEPSTWCRDLKLSLVPEVSVLTLFFMENDSHVKTSLCVRVPQVLVDPEPQPQVRAFDDHIEVKLVLLLPVDHPIVSDMNSILKSEENGAEVHPLSVDSGKYLPCFVSSFWELSLVFVYHLRRFELFVFSSFLPSIFFFVKITLHSFCFVDIQI